MKTKEVIFRLFALGLILLSFVPQIFVLPLLGEINLIFLLLLWIVFLVLFKLLARGQMLVASILLAVAMAFPPIPNWMWYSNSGELLFRFIGWSNLSREGYNIAFFLVLYLAIFVGVTFLLKKDDRIQDRTIRV